MLCNDKKFIGKVLRDARKRAKLTQAELAEKIDMTDKNLGNIENGKQYPALDSFFKMLSELDLTLDDFETGVKELPLDQMVKILSTLDKEKAKIYLTVLRLINRL